MTDQSQAPAQGQHIIKLSDYTPYPYKVEGMALEFDLEPSVTKVRATTTFASAHDRSKGIKALVLQGEHLKLRGVSLDGVPLAPSDYVVTETDFTLPIPPERFTLVIDVEINPEANKASTLR